MNQAGTQPDPTTPTGPHTRPPDVTGLHPQPQGFRARMAMAWQLSSGYVRAASIHRLKSSYPLRWAVAWVLSALTVPIQAVKVGFGRRTTYYADDNAVLAVKATRHGWEIGDHVARTPRSGHGRELRAKLIPELTRHADATGTAVLLVAANEKLAKQYEQEIPGLTRTGAGFPRGITMQRNPGGKPVAVSDMPDTSALRRLQNWGRGLLGMEPRERLTPETLPAATARLTKWVVGAGAALTVLMLLGIIFYTDPDRYAGAVTATFFLLVNHGIAYWQLRRIATALMRRAVTVPEWLSATEATRTLRGASLALVALAPLAVTLPALRGVVDAIAETVVGIILLGTTAALLIQGRDATDSLDYAPEKPQ